MKAFSQLLVGLLSALGTSLLVLAAGTLALVEGGVDLTAPQAQPTTSTAAVTALPPGQPSLTPSPTPVIIHCNVPHGWQPYIVKLGDTLDSIAGEVGLSAEQIYAKNCLYSRSLPPGTTLYLPAAGPTATSVPALPTITPEAMLTALPTLTLCGPPSFWVPYIVRSGDTIYRLSVILGISQDMLLNANCLTNSTLYVGQRIFVPFTPAPPPTLPSYPTLTPLPSATPVTPSATSISPSATPVTPEATVVPSEVPTINTEEPPPVPTDGIILPTEGTQGAP